MMRKEKTVRMMMMGNLDLKKRIIIIKLRNKMKGMSLKVRRVTPQLKFIHHNYLPLYFPSILLLFPSLNGWGTLEYRPYLKKIFP